MLLFRSEEHVDRWCAKTGSPRGASFSTEQAWRLAQDLYGDRLSLSWRRLTAQEYEEMFARAGLRGEFWTLS